MKDRAHITVQPKRPVIFRGADMVDEITKLKAEIERLKKLDEIGSKAHNANLLEMADMRAVIARLTAERDAAYVRGLECAHLIASVCSSITTVLSAIQSEIDKAKAGK